MRKLFLLFLVTPFFLIAQSESDRKEIDSLRKIIPTLKNDSIKVKILNKISYKNYGLIQERKKYAEEALAISVKTNYEIGKANSYLSLSKIYSNEFEKEKALENLNKSLQIFTKLKNNIKLASIYNLFGNIYLDNNDYPNALKNYLKAASLNEELKNSEKLAANYSNIADIYKDFKDLKKTLYYGNLSNKYAILANDDSILIYNYFIFTKLYSDLNNLEKADFYVRKAYYLSVKINDPNNIAVSLIGIGTVLRQRQNFIEAISKIENGIKFFNIIGNSRGTASAYNELGLCYFNLYEKTKDNSKLTNAKNSFIKSNELYFENDLIDGLPNNYLYLSKIFKIKRNFSESLENLNLHLKFKDSVFNSENKETIKNLEDKREIELRDKEIKINKLSLEAKEKQKWYLFGGIGLLSIIGGLLFYQSRKRKQINSKLEILNQNLDSKNIELDHANKAKTRFFSILNHDLRGPVVNLINFLQLQTESPEMLDAESTKRMQDKTMTGAENLLASMEDILQWSKSQMENFKPQPKNLTVNQLFNDTKKVFSGYLKITFEYHNPSNIEIFTDENYLKTVVRNLTSNAINVFTSTENPTIIWKAWQTNNQSFLSVTDNGPGADAEKLKALFDESEIGSSKSGLGLHLIRDMAKAIACEISVESKIGEGTTFVLKLA